MGGKRVEDLSGVTKQHKMILVNRKNCSLTGITDVIAFDEKEVILETQMGTLWIKGENLHMKRLTLEQGEVEVDGVVDSYLYSGQKSFEQKESLWGRLFR